MSELYAIITGKVQGVSYRDYVQVSASKLKLTGFVRNNRDGSARGWSYYATLRRKLHWNSGVN